MITIYTNPTRVLPGKSTGPVPQYQYDPTVIFLPLFLLIQFNELIR